MFTKSGLFNVLAAAGLLSVATSATAAVGGMHSSNTIWDGVYVGADIGIAKPAFSNKWLSGAFAIENLELSTPRTRLDRADSIAGLHAGFTQAQNSKAWGYNWFWGAEGSYMPKQVRNTTRYSQERGHFSGSEHSIYELDSMTSIRGRLGLVIDDDNALYAGAGVSVVDMRFGATTSDSAGDGDSGEFVQFRRVYPALNVGFEHKLTDSFVVNIMAEHVFATSKRSTDGLGDGRNNGTQEGYVRSNGLTTGTVGLSYYFS